MCEESYHLFIFSFCFQKGSLFFDRMEKLLSERRDYCVIDPAYDYIEILDQTDGTFKKNNSQFDGSLVWN